MSHVTSTRWFLLLLNSKHDSSIDFNDSLRYAPESILLSKFYFCVKTQSQNSTTILIEVDPEQYICVIRLIGSSLLIFLSICLESILSSRYLNTHSWVWSTWIKVGIIGTDTGHNYKVFVCQLEIYHFDEWFTVSLSLFLLLLFTLFHCSFYVSLFSFTFAFCVFIFHFVFRFEPE